LARLAFLGTPEVAAGFLYELVGAGHEVALAVTRADKRRGRGPKTSPSPVKQAALELGVPVSHDLSSVTEAGVELGVVVAFGRLVPAEVLAQVPMLNVHFSLLPRWRGAAPVERAILAGDEETGVCLMALDEGMDTGPIYCCERTPILEGETADELRRRLAAMGRRLLVEALAEGVAGLPAPVPQQGEATLAPKLSPEELYLDWTRPAEELERVVRVGRAWTTWRGRRLLVLRARRGDGARTEEPGTLVGSQVVAGGGSTLELVEVQAEGRRPVPAREWLRGARPGPGERLGG
jgi:methionyl-tRNA formyltransferase